jgi:ribosomal protein S8
LWVEKEKNMNKYDKAFAEFTMIDVVAVACTIFRQQGFVKKSDITQNQMKSNATLLYDYFYSNKTVQIEPTTEDQKVAKDIVEYLKGLTFKAFERKLTEFETNVLKFVNCETVGRDKLGIAASLPHVYQSKLRADGWCDRETQLGMTSEFVGTLRTRGKFTLKIENIRYIAKTQSTLISCSENNRNIVKFFYSKLSANVGDTIIVSGFVKSQQISSHTGFKETMLNRISTTCLFLE